MAKNLAINKFSSGALHGSLTQGIRDRVMGQFREGNIDILKMSSCDTLYSINILYKYRREFLLMFNFSKPLIFKKGTGKLPKCGLHGAFFQLQERVRFMQLDQKNKLTNCTHRNASIETVSIIIYHK